MKINIPFTLSKDFYPSVWSSDECFIRAGELAEITEVIVASGMNPLYRVKNAAGKEKAIHRRFLVEHGFNPIEEENK